MNSNRLRCPRCGAKHRVMSDGHVPSCDIKKWRRMKNGNQSNQ